MTVYEVKARIVDQSLELMLEKQKDKLVKI